MLKPKARTFPTTVNTPQAANYLTENLLVGTYTMIQSATGGMARFAFVNKRFLDLTGLDRETVTADPLSFFACFHPGAGEGGHIRPE